MTGNPLSKTLNDLYKEWDKKSPSNVFVNTQVKCNIGEKEDMSYETQMNLCRQYAAQAWCKENTSHIDMNPALCEEFAKILHFQIYEKGSLGTATTRELLTELTFRKARIEVLGESDYKTIGEDLESNDYLRGETER